MLDPLDGSNNIRAWRTPSPYVGIGLAMGSLQRLGKYDDTDQKPKLLRIKEAAEMLGVNPETLRRWDNDGRLKAVRTGKRGDRRYKLEDLQKILDDKKI